MVVGFLLLATSGLTITIHHEHPIEDILIKHGHSHSEESAAKTTSSTYQEIHFVKLLSGDSFNGSQKIELKTSLVKLFAVHLVPLELSLVFHAASLTNIDIKETSPPSVDRYTLNCSFLI